MQTLSAGRRQPHHA